MSIRIIVTPAGPGNCYAHFEGQEHTSSAGDCPRTAIGNLITNHGKNFGIEVVNADTGVTMAPPRPREAAEWPLDYGGVPRS